MVEDELAAQVEAQVSLSTSRGAASRSQPIFDLSGSTSAIKWTVADEPLTGKSGAPLFQSILPDTANSSTLSTKRSKRRKRAKRNVSDSIYSALY